MKMTPAAAQALLGGDTENFIAASTPGGIEAQEAAGQKRFVASEVLPKECPREDLEKLGFIFGDDADDIFISVQFPEGWWKRATDHSMWSDLIDDKGHKRGSIFYKAAFYDRSSFMRMDRRFSAQKDYESKGYIQYRVLDCDSVVFETEKVTCGEDYKENWEIGDTLLKVATDWLDKEHPDWKSPLAYWD